MTDLPGDCYGRFSEDGTEYIVTDPRTPRPWANIIANPRMGMAVSQSGGGFTWIDNSQLATITSWQQDFARDESGKFLYLRDAETGRIHSLSPGPVWSPYDGFECRHGLGYTEFRTLREGIEARWALFVHPEATVELWRVELRNVSGRPRSLELSAFLEWCCGVAPAPRREFHKLFIETRYDADLGVVFATSHMWDVGSPRWGHWNTDFPYVAAFGGAGTASDALGDKAAFLGRNGSLRAPAALADPRWARRFGRHEDPIAALRYGVALDPGETKRVDFVLAVSETSDAAAALVAAHASTAAVDGALEAARAAWRDRLAAHRIETYQPTLDALVNDWTRYQAISARMWGRCGYYQQSGAVGFRDQLQDSQVWLTIDPDRCRDQVRLHAAHQFVDGSVHHWWHPLSGQGLVTRMTDDLLWLAFVASSYLKETGDFSILDDTAPFLDGPPAPLHDHVQRAFGRVFERTSARGIPFIGAGDWNDGLSAVGLEERGESFWLAEFLAGLLADWSEISRRRGDTALGEECASRRKGLVEAINRHGWDGGWYLRGTLDDGSLLGSDACEEGKIFLNAQTWAILADVAPADRAAACMAAVERYLVSDAGALLLSPAYVTPRREIGYITRYAPGMRENGGVYTHAATWAIAAACKTKNAALVERLLGAMDPTCKDPERYQAEPYVLPGNVDGPASPYHGRAGWTWYTGSAAWFHRVVSEWILGVRPSWDGLLVDPCLPADWQRAAMTRPWRGDAWSILIDRVGADAGSTGSRVIVDGASLRGSVIPVPRGTGARHEVHVLIR